MTAEWVRVHHPICIGDSLPPERRCVLVWCASSHLPWVGYLRYAAGCLDSPFFVVPHGNPNRGTDVIAWCDCLPTEPPEGFPNMNLAGRGFPARVADQ
jgi:hypothetical protein